MLNSVFLIYRRHDANLNFGDCFAYALAKDQSAPLLFKGDDFSQTDVIVAPFEVAIPHGHAISGVVLADQTCSVSWEKRYVKIAGTASAKLIDEVRERLGALLQVD